MSFDSDIDKTEQEAILDAMKTLGITYERANHSYIALDLEPDKDYDMVLRKLYEFEEQGIFDFETCEAKMERSFDASP